MPRDFMVLTPFSCFLLHLFIALLLLWIGLVVLRVALFSLSLAVWVGDAFSLLQKWGVLEHIYFSKLLDFE
jgi:hypothetical protein